MTSSYWCGVYEDESSTTAVARHGYGFIQRARLPGDRQASSAAEVAIIAHWRGLNKEKFVRSAENG